MPSYRPVAVSRICRNNNLWQRGRSAHVKLNGGRSRSFYDPIASARCLSDAMQCALSACIYVVRDAVRVRAGRCEVSAAACTPVSRSVATPATMWCCVTTARLGRCLLLTNETHCSWAPPHISFHESRDAQFAQTAALTTAGKIEDERATGRQRKTSVDCLLIRVREVMERQ